MLALLRAVAARVRLCARRPDAAGLHRWVSPRALALATHYYAVLAVVPQAVWLLLDPPTRRPVRRVRRRRPVRPRPDPARDQPARPGRGNWISARRSGDGSARSCPILERLRGTRARIFGPLAIAIVVLSFGSAPDPVAGRGAARRCSAGGLALAGFVLSLILVAVGFDDLLTRNMLGDLVGLRAPRRRRAVGAAPAVLWVSVGAIVLCVMGVIDRARRCLRSQSMSGPTGAWWRGRSVRTRLPGGRAILVQHYRDLLPLSLYMPGLKVLAGRSARAGPRVRRCVVHSPASAGFCWWGSACNLWPSRTQSSYPIAGFRPVSETACPPVHRHPNGGCSNRCG